MLFHDAAMMTISIASAPTMFGSHIPGQMSFRKAKKPTPGWKMNWKATAAAGAATA